MECILQFGDQMFSTVYVLDWQYRDCLDGKLPNQQVSTIPITLTPLCFSFSSSVSIIMQIYWQLQFSDCWVMIHTVDEPVEKQCVIVCHEYSKPNHCWLPGPYTMVDQQSSAIIRERGQGVWESGSGIYDVVLFIIQCIFDTRESCMEKIVWELNSTGTGWCGIFIISHRG